MISEPRIQWPAKKKTSLTDDLKETEKPGHIKGYCLSLSKWSLNLDLQFLCISSSWGRDQPSEAINSWVFKDICPSWCNLFFVHIGISFSNCSILKKKRTRKKRGGCSLCRNNKRCLFYLRLWYIFFCFCKFCFLVAYYCCIYYSCIISSVDYISKWIQISA